MKAITKTITQLTLAGLMFATVGAYSYSIFDSNPPYNPYITENGDIYGQDNDGDGRVETTYVRGYYKSDGTYVRSHYRAK
tara:strand:- start:178 stop:417 length:240 start_codon:yes stop_codon:yes gene_type:complete